MKTLFVSYDCGLRYSKLMQSENINELLHRTKQKDMEWLRWYIEDENGEMDHEHLSPIHRNIINLMKWANGGKY